MKNSKFLTALAVGALAIGASAPALAAGDKKPCCLDDDIASAPPLAKVPELSAGMKAPTIDVGTFDQVQKATVSYSNSIGSSDSFSVGALTNIGATVSAQSTPDYDVTSTSTFIFGGSNVNQVIGTSSTLPNSDAKITGQFAKAYTPDTIDNNVTVSGIGTDAVVKAADTSTFTTDIKKNDNQNLGAGSANGAAGGSVGTTTTASANSSQFVSSFAQAY